MIIVLQTGCHILGILCFVYLIFLMIFFRRININFGWIWIAGGVYFFLLASAMDMVMAYVEPLTVLWLAFLLGLLIFALALIFIYLPRIVKGMTAPVCKDLDCIIILGAQVLPGPRLSRVLKQRIDRALSYARKYRETSIILSGGRGKDEEISEAWCMFRYMTEKGMDKDRLIMEDRSTSTEENLRYSLKLCSVLGEHVGIITSDFHMYRALKLAKSIGFTDAHGIPAPSLAPAWPHNMIREVLCLFRADAGIFLGRRLDAE